MNKYEQRAEQGRRSALRSSMTVGTAGLALIVVLLLIAGLNGSAPPQFYWKAAIGLAVVLLVLRQVNRRLSKKGPRGAQPDSRSRLNLN